MTEEQFWHSNLRKIETYEKAYKLKHNSINSFVYSYVGAYGMSALVTAIDGVLNGKKSKNKYIEKPIDLFELTAEEKAEREAIEAEKNRQQAVNFFNSLIKKYGKEGVNE